MHTWTSPGTTQQYYPLVHTAFWIEDKIWGQSTLGYHLVNISLHLLAAFLLFQILARLQIPGAWIAASVFALHPIEVESVAWISELKNTLSAVCYLGAALIYLRFDKTRDKRAYAAAFLIFAAGLMAKTVIATLPAALLVVFWWERGTLSWKRDAVWLIPFFAVGMAAGLFTSHMETAVNGARGSDFNYNFIERCLIAGRVVCFYFGKIVWPAELIFIYPHWDIHSQAPWQYAFPLLAIFVIVIAWLARGWSRGPVAALLFFAGTLFPALGFFDVFPFRYSFVADHFQYLAGIGIIVLGCAAIDLAFRQLHQRREAIEKTFCAALLALLAVLTWRESRIYTNVQTLWETTLARNPSCWLAEDDLGALYFDSGDLDKAARHIKASIKLRPDNAEAHNNLGAVYLRQDKADAAIEEFRLALKARPHFPEAMRNLAVALLQKGDAEQGLAMAQSALKLRDDLPKFHDTAAGAYLRNGRTNEAIAEFQAVLDRQPDAQGYYNLGNLLLRQSRAQEAEAEFMEAVRLNPKFVEAENNIGNLQLGQGRIDEAIAHLEAALKARPDYAPAHFNLGNAFLRQGRVMDALVEFKKLIALDPNSATPRNSLSRVAWILSTSPRDNLRNGAEALNAARQLDQLTGGTNPAIVEVLAASCAETGNFTEAVSAADRAIELATQQGNTALAKAMQAQLESYKMRRPFRDRALP